MRPRAGARVVTMVTSGDVVVTSLVTTALRPVVLSRGLVVTSFRGFGQNNGNGSLGLLPYSSPPSSPLERNASNVSWLAWCLSTSFRHHYVTMATTESVRC